VDGLKDIGGLDEDFSSLIFEEFDTSSVFCKESCENGFIALKEGGATKKLFVCVAHVIKKKNEFVKVCDCVLSEIERRCIRHNDVACGLDKVLDDKEVVSKDLILCETTNKDDILLLFFRQFVSLLLQFSPLTHHFFDPRPFVQPRGRNVFSWRRL